MGGSEGFLLDLGGGDCDTRWRVKSILCVGIEDVIEARRDAQLS